MPTTSVAGQSLARILCAECPPLSPCPPCAKGQMCQLSIPASCADCPVNTCVLDPIYKESSGNNNKAKIGGAVGGLLALILLAGLIYWLFVHRPSKKREAEKNARIEATMKTAEKEKFRPGGPKSTLDQTLISQAGMDDKGAATKTSNPFVERGEAPKVWISSMEGEGLQEEEMEDEDTEWTVLREDGLTAYRKPPKGEDLISPNKGAKRRSIGAATHLSRITENAEEEDGEAKSQRKAQRHGQTVVEEEEPSILSREHGSSGHSSSTSISSEGNVARSRKSKGSTTLSVMNPFSDTSDVASIFTSEREWVPSVRRSDDGSSSKSWTAFSLEPPSPALRATGAAVVDLQGKSKPKTLAKTGPETQPPLMMVSQYDAHGQPIRPMRRPGLDLRLDELQSEGLTVEQHSGVLAEFRESENFLSPAAPSTSRSQHFDVRRGTGNFPSKELLSSRVYRHNMPSIDEPELMPARRMSSMTASSVGTVGYMMSSPRIMIINEMGGVQRLQFKQEKAHLVRTVSGASRVKEGETLEGASGHSISMAHQERPSSRFSLVEIVPHKQDPFQNHGNVTPGRKQNDSSMSLPLFCQRAWQSGYSEGGIKRMSTLSAESFGLPFVDTSRRTLQSPLDRSPTDACARDSFASTVSRPLLAAVASGDSGRAPGTTFKQTNSRNTSDSSSNQRMSSSSIGGLSVFDDIPFQISSGTSISLAEHQMPDDARTKIRKAKESTVSASSQEQANPLLQHSLAQQQARHSAPSQHEVMQAHPLAQIVTIS